MYPILAVSKKSCRCQNKQLRNADEIWKENNLELYLVRGMEECTRLVLDEQTWAEKSP